MSLMNSHPFETFWNHQLWLFKWKEIHDTTILSRCRTCGALCRQVESHPSHRWFDGQVAGLQVFGGPGSSKENPWKTGTGCERCHFFCSSKGSYILTQSYLPLPPTFISTWDIFTDIRWGNSYSKFWRGGWKKQTEDWISGWLMDQGFLEVGVFFSWTCFGDLFRSASMWCWGLELEFSSSVVFSLVADVEFVHPKRNNKKTVCNPLLRHQIFVGCDLSNIFANKNTVW